MRARRAAILASLMGLWLVPAVAWAAPSAAEQQALKAKVEDHFKVAASRTGVVLVPRRDVPGLTTIEVADGSVSLDGLVVTGDELRQRLGGDADTVLQLSYLDAATLRSLFAAAAAAPGVQREPERRVPDTWDDRETRRSRRGGARIRIAESLTIAEDETVPDAVVAIGGSVTVNGRAEDNVVAVGGSVHLGPKAYVRGDVVAIGGTVTREAGAEVRGRISEVGFGRGEWRGPVIAWPPIDWEVGRWFAFAGTLLRVAFVLFLVALIAVIAAAPVRVVGGRVAQAPWIALLVGVAVQVLFGPALVALVIALLISIVGIPLLVLVPFVVFGAIAFAFVGFTGVAARVGAALLPGPGGAGRPALTTALVGALALMAVTILARLIGLLPQPLGWLAVGIGAAGFAIEYVAWTVGLGAAVMAAVEWRRQPAVPPVPAV